jgi:hypothetical protein
MRRLLLLGLLALAACKGDPVKCDQSCRHYAELVYWNEWDPVINASPVEKREALRREKLADFENRVMNGVQTCVTQCVSANNDDTTDCLINAKTAISAKACVE